MASELEKSLEGHAILSPAYARIRYIYPYNFSRNPMLSLAWGFDDEGLLIGMQLMGKHFDEAGCVGVRTGYE